jgi:CHAT domain-containing protein/tetratricopeptide (TPR) repeat protein
MASSLIENGLPAAAWKPVAASLKYLLAAVSFIVFARASAAQAPGTAATFEEVAPGRTVEFQVKPEGNQIYSVSLQANQSATVFIEQNEGLVEVSWTDSSGLVHAPRTNDAGRFAAIRFSLSDARGGQHNFELKTYGPNKSPTGRFRVSVVKQLSEEDVLQLEAEEWLAQAERDRRKGERATWPAALEKYDRAAAFFKNGGDANLLRSALVGKSRLLTFKLNQYVAAREAAQQAVALDSAGKDLPGQGLAWKTLGSAYYFVADYPASIEAAQKAVQFYRQTKDLYWQGIILGNLAYMQRELGNTYEALAASQQALDLAREIHDTFGVAFNLEALATIHLSRGELEQAFQLYYQALDEVRAHPYPAVEAAIWSGLGDLYVQLEDSGQAEDCYKKALLATEQANDSAGQVKVLSNLGDLYFRRGHLPEALAEYQRGLSKADTLSLAREQSLLWTGLGTSYTALKEDVKAREAFDNAISIARRISHKDAEAHALLMAGDFYARAGDLSSAREAYQKAFELWKEESNRGQSAVALASLAQLDYSTGGLQAARSEIEQAIDLVETSRASISSRELRTSYFASKHSYYGLSVAILMQLHENEPGKNYDALAFQVAERARARTLLDALGQAEPAAWADAPPELLAEQQRNRQHLDALYRRLREVSENAITSESQMPKLRSEIEGVLRLSDELNARLRASSPRFAALTGGQPSTISNLQDQALDDQTAIAEYWVGEHESYLWVITSKALKSYSLPGRDDLDPLVQQWLSAILARSNHTAGESLAARTARLARTDSRANTLALRLGEILVAPLGNVPELQRVYLVADGNLASVPFGALRVPNRLHSKVQKNSDLVVSRFEILEEPSASVLLTLSRDDVQKHRDLRVAVFADPVYSRKDPRLRRLTLHPTSESSSDSIVRWATETGLARLPRLTASRDEALEIAGLAGRKSTSMHMGFDATPESVRTTDWEQFSIAHFAAHALSNPSHPALSGVVLSMVGRDGAPLDGLLWVSDIYSLHFPVDLAVLSGCRTASGQQVPGEGLQGLARAFLVAGARRVLGSLWSVEDQQTGLLMRRFYRGLLREHLPPPSALRKAQRELAETSAPYYWAGFTMQGASGWPEALTH